MRVCVGSVRVRIRQPPASSSKLTATVGLLLRYCRVESTSLRLAPGSATNGSAVAPLETADPRSKRGGGLGSVRRFFGDLRDRGA